MKVWLNEFEVLELTQTQLDVIANDIPVSELEDDIKRRIVWTLKDEKYERCYKRLFEEWFPKLAARGLQSIPTDKDAFAELVFSQPDYKNRSARELAAKQAMSGE